MKSKQYIRYGEAFKRQVVEEIETGKLGGVNDASRRYGIRGKNTVSNWLRQYGREDLQTKRITITTMKEQDENKQLKKRVKELERALSDAYMKGMLSDSYLEIACEQMGMDPETFKKKHVMHVCSDAPQKPKP